MPEAGGIHSGHPHIKEEGARNIYKQVIEALKRALDFVLANQAAPQLAAAVPTAITACGALIAAFSAPPTLSERGK